MSAPRPLIENVLRAMVVDDGRVTFLTGRAVGVRRDGDCITGIDVETSSGRGMLGAELVVDATGSGSQATSWLRAAGWDVPRVDSDAVTHWYVTAAFGRPDDWRGRDDFWLVFPTYPGTRGGLVSPEARDVWRVSVSGSVDDPPPRTPAELVAYAASLESGMIADVLERARPLGPATLFRKPTATWRRYDEMDHPLAGFLPIGDAVASLDPLFGQGIAVAVWQATILADLLRAGLGSPSQFTETYVRRSAGACESAWSLGRMVNAAPEGLARSVGSDPAVHRAYVAAWHLFESVADPVPAVAR
jgi:2-polyprenyl-6-methoxyphenol hydroxylase-like FAD-dependent oxidoreductase